MLPTNINHSYVLEYHDFLERFRLTHSLSNEGAFERLYTGLTQNDENTTITWYKNQRLVETMVVEPIDLSDCEPWILSNDAIQRKDNEFFKIGFYKVENPSNREVATGWNQPMIEQVGYDGGILGMIRTRFKGVPHYLVEAKAEPGNYKTVQISPTLQATNANISKKHGGRRPKYFEYFDLQDQSVSREVLVDQWVSEDGGRFYKKRNRIMLVEIDNACSGNFDASETIWVPLKTLVTLIRDYDAIVNPHVRSIISAI